MLDFFLINIFPVWGGPLNWAGSPCHPPPQPGDLGGCHRSLSLRGSQTSFVSQPRFPGHRFIFPQFPLGAGDQKPHPFSRFFPFFSPFFFSHGKPAWDCFTGGKKKNEKPPGTVHFLGGGRGGGGPLSQDLCVPNVLSPFFFWGGAFPLVRFFFFGQSPRFTPLFWVFSGLFWAQKTFKKPPTFFFIPPKNLGRGGRGGGGGLAGMGGASFIPSSPPKLFKSFSGWEVGAG